MADIECYNPNRLSFPCSVKQMRRLGILAGKKEKRLKGSVTISIVEEKIIKSINQKYRKHNKVTDVLSFPFQDKEQFITPDKKSHLGEIFMCPTHVQKQARRFEVSYQNEFVRMLIHGLLHLVGHDHVAVKDAEKMFTIQEDIVSEVYKKIFKKPVNNYPIKLLKQRHDVYLV